MLPLRVTITCRIIRTRTHGWRNGGVFVPLLEATVVGLEGLERMERDESKDVIRRSASGGKKSRRDEIGPLSWIWKGMASEIPKMRALGMKN